MMLKKITIVLIACLTGFAIGYLLFGKIGGEYLDLSTIFGNSGGDFGALGRKVTGIAKIKSKILISTSVGILIGIALLFIKKK